MRWFDHGTLAATWTNRVQNISQIVTYSTTGMWHPLHDQELSHGWLQNSVDPPILRDRFMLLIKPQSSGNPNLGTFQHITRFDLLNGNLNRELDLTPGNLTVHRVYGINELKRLIYFSATPGSEPSQRHLYSVSLQSDNPRPKCLSCDYVTPEGMRTPQTFAPHERKEKIKMKNFSGQII